MKIFYSMLFVLLVVSCDNDENEVDEHKWDAVVLDYLSKYDSVKNKETFIFFTDPHLLSANNNFSYEVKSNIESSLLPMKYLYSLFPINFCLCGGDWLNYGDTQEVAKQKLLYADSQMKNMFSRYYKMMGNHDTNYQGVISSDNSSRGDFSRVFIDKEYFQETGSAYYSFNADKTKFFILDSGLDWSPEMDDYKWEQIDWFGSQLLSNSIDHIVIGIHMFYNSFILPLSSELGKICVAYNNRSKIEINGKTYDYSNAKGIIHLILTGHRHIDTIDYENGIPIVGTCRYIQDSTPTFDICILDYNSNKMKIIRVGKGENREVELFTDMIRHF